MVGLEYRTVREPKAQNHLCDAVGTLPTSTSTDIVYRYSEEHRYRPAASPVITEYLKDGRIRLRGATPGGVGIKPGDLPMTPQQKMYLKKRQKEEAEAKAKEALKERRRRRKEQLIAKKRKAYADRDP